MDVSICYALRKAKVVSVDESDPHGRSHGEKHDHQRIILGILSHNCTDTSEIEA